MLLLLAERQAQIEQKGELVCDGKLVDVNGLGLINLLVSPLVIHNDVSLE